MSDNMQAQWTTLAGYVVGHQATWIVDTPAPSPSRRKRRDQDFRETCRRGMAALDPRHRSAWMAVAAA